MGVFANIQKVLDVRLKALPSNPYIAWPNTQFKPANYLYYVRPTLLMGRTELYTLNDHEQIPGIYQINIATQLNRGVQQAYSLADEIKSHFESDRELTEGNTIVLIQGISIGQAEAQDAWWRTFVEVSFLTYNS